MVGLQSEEVTAFLQVKNFFEQLRVFFIVYKECFVSKFIEYRPGSRQFAKSGSGSRLEFFKSVWQIRDVYPGPGSRIPIFTHPGSRSRIQKQQQKRVVKKI
jgi:hypothetical protein